MKELVVEAIVDNLASVLAFLDAELEAVFCPLKAQMQLDVAVEEIFSNVCYYAYQPDTGKFTIQIEITETDPRTVTIHLIDAGKPFDPTKREDPDVTLSAKDRNIGGLGIYVTKKSVDEMHYERHGNENVLTLIKAI